LVIEVLGIIWLLACLRVAAWAKAGAWNLVVAACTATNIAFLIPSVGQEM